MGGRSIRRLHCELRSTVRSDLFEHFTLRDRMLVMQSYREESRLQKHIAEHTTARGRA
jgi:hypothetical protein